MNQRRKRRRDMERWRKNQPVWGKSPVMGVFELLHHFEAMNDAIWRSFQLNAREYFGEVKGGAK